MTSNDIIKVENLSNTKDTFTIRWNVTYLCNYSCAFCIQGNKNTHIIKSKGESEENRRFICNHLITFIETNLNKKYKEIQMYLIGGELTILPDFLEMLSKIVNCNFEGLIQIHITTNLSADESLLNSLVTLFNQKYANERVLEVSASYYKDYTTEEEFINKVKLLYGKNNLKNRTIGRLFNNRSLVFKFRKLLGKKLFNKGKKIANKIQPIHVNIGYPLCIDEDYKDYIAFVKKYSYITRKINFIIIREYEKSISPKLKKKINKKYYKSNFIKVTIKDGSEYLLSSINQIRLLLDEENYFNPKNYLCDIGTNSISIDNLGIVSRCVSCKNDTILGDIKKETIVLPKTKFICKCNKCTCNYYTLIEKV